MKRTIKMISVIVILTMAVVTVYAGGWNKSLDPINKANKTEVDEVQKIIESFMKTEDFNNKFFANKAKMTIEEFREFLKKPVSDKEEVTEAEILAVGCMRCNQGGKYIEIDRSCSVWSATGNQKICTHKNFGVDLEYIRHCYSTKKCDKCGYQISGSWDETKWECRGFNDGSID